MSSLIENGTLAQLFATPIWTFKPKNAAALADSVSERVRALLRADSGATAKAIWQSRPNLHLDPAFEDLTLLIAEASRAVISLLAYDCELGLTGLWANISGATDSLHEHSHPNNLLSGVFYAAVPDGAGETAFKDPRPQARVLRPRIVRDTPLNSVEFRFRGTPGTLIVFPAWLEHGVTRSTSSAERITVAFNLMAKGPLGSRELLAYSGV
jgi:uncharacterized protein (TIGR02466 family)